jgi:hypothetical protein
MKLLKLHATSSQSGDETQSPRGVSSWLRDMLDLNQEDRKLLLFLVGQPKSLQYFVISPSFEDAEQRSFAVPLLASFPVLKDAYLAYAGVLKSIHPSSKNEIDEDVNLRRASSAMMTLRSLAVATPEDAALCLTLGLALVIFVYAAIGVGVSDICHYCLSIQIPFIETVDLDTDTEPRLIFLVLLETMECMVHRRKPTLRIHPRTVAVDCHLGLCLPLLPCYYDLCAISYSMANASDTNLIVSIQQQLDGIQVFVETWQPSQPENFLNHFRAAEVVHLLAQARVYRLAALLMAHRLRHIFGHEDAKADIWSREVMMELELAQRITNQPIRFVTLPFIIAAVEIQDSVALIKAVEDVDRYVDQFTPVVQRATKTFLSRVWRERDLRTTFSWFDSVHKPCVVLDSIGASSFPLDAFKT